MPTKAVNLKMEESRIADLKQVAAVFHMSMTDVINEALDMYIPIMKKDPLYKLTANVKEASKTESEEILSEIDNLTDDDLEISTVKHFIV